MLLNGTNPLMISAQGKEWQRNHVTAMSLGQLNQGIKETEGAIAPRIKEMLRKVELSVSFYDTAWVAMVPSSDSSNKPLFPKCLKWVMENQQPDGSWGLDIHHPLLVKDSLSSTLACVLALQKWNVGHQLIHKGVEFIESNIWAAADDHQHSPIGFDIIFPSMIESGRDMGLNISSLNQSLLQGMLLRRDFQTQSLKDKPRNLAYFAEGLNGLNNWKGLMKYQRSNGSLFNSPSSTAAAFIHLRDQKCFQYLNLLDGNCQIGVPTLYPFDMYARLSILDSLERLGIDRYVSTDKEIILDDIYRCWMEGNEEILLDPKYCAMAFRILRMNGYTVFSDAFAKFDGPDILFDAKDTKSILELFKASLVTINEDEPVLDHLNAWTSTYLRHKLQNNEIQDKSLQAEVDYTLRHAHANLVRLEHRRNIEHHNLDEVSLLKTSYRFCNIDNEDLLTVSSQDFNTCQSMHLKELEYVEGWVKKCGIDKLKYARQKTKYAAFSVSSTMFEPEFSNARISWAQNSVLTSIVDDFFDYGGSMEELLNLTELVERWEEHATIGYKSKEVEIVFNAIYSTTNDLADKARLVQGRCVKSHMMDLWIVLVKSMLKEAEWQRNNIVPTMDEFIPNACISFAQGPIILTSIYLVEPLSEEVINSKEYDTLFMIISRLGRLFNDLVTIERDIELGELNTVILEVIHGKGRITEEEVKKKVAKTIETHTRKLLRMVLETEGSIVPKACKDFFWAMSNVLHVFYMGDDKYTSPTKMMASVNTIINEPIVLPQK